MIDRDAALCCVCWSQSLVVTTYEGEELRLSAEDQRELRRWKQSLRFAAGGGGALSGSDDDADSMASWPSSSSMDDSEQCVTQTRLLVAFAWVVLFAPFCCHQRVCVWTVLMARAVSARLVAAAAVAAAAATVTGAATMTRTTAGGPCRQSGPPPSLAAPASATGQTARQASSRARTQGGAPAATTRRTA
jgi:hypothetical protein|eukprot:COSAG06_NODE_3039_length_5928_cov_49.157145_5_plen_190_part_00